MLQKLGKGDYSSSICTLSKICWGASPIILALSCKSFSQLAKTGHRTTTTTIQTRKATQRKNRSNSKISSGVSKQAQFQLFVLGFIEQAAA